MGYLPDKQKCLEEAYDALHKATYSGGMSDRDIEHQKAYSDIAMGWLMLADRIGSDLPARATQDSVS